MPVSPSIGLTILTLIASVFIIIISVWNLYLSHYRENRSEIKILREESNAQPSFTGGSHSTGSRARWTGQFYLKIANSGDKGAYISSFDHELKGLKKDDKITDAQNVELEVGRTGPSWVGTEIEPHSSKRYRRGVTISPENDIGVLIEHDSAVVQHTLRVEDNKGSYEVTHETEIELVGPNGAIENWEEQQEE